MREIKIPVGISDFKEIREGSYYYIPESVDFLLQEMYLPAVFVWQRRVFLQDCIILKYIL